MENNNTKRHKVFFYVFGVLTLLHVVFIFSNSLKNAAESNSHSGFFVKFVIEFVLGLDYSEQSPVFIADVTHYVRKFAHFSEFALLSIYFLSTALSYGKRIVSSVIPSILFCFAIGCTDEFLQRFSEGRSCQLYDAFIDCAGGIFGAAVFCAVFFLLKKCLRRINE